MSRGEEKAKWWRIWRPRFSIRTLVVLVTLACAYLAAWMPTRRAAERIGSPDNPTPWVDSGIGRVWVVRKNAHSPAPLVLTQVEWEPIAAPKKVRCQYYLWLFGSKIKLPFLWTHYTPGTDDGQEVRLTRDDFR